MKSIYLDWAATSPVNNDIPHIISDILLNYPGNPSSIHDRGIEARNIIDSNRKLCSNLLKVKPEQLIFTSGGTESNNIIISSFFRKKFRGEFIISGIEHPSIFEFIPALKDASFSPVVVQAESGGIIDPESIKNLLSADTQFVTVMAINNETGAIQNIEGIVKIIRNFEKSNGRKIHIHTDAVQILGKYPFYPGKIDIDSASFSGHKIGAPKGTGLLYLKKPVQPLSPGGGQEFGIRPGTENTAGIAAFSKALEVSLGSISKNMDHIDKLKNTLIGKLSSIDGIKILFQEPYSSYSPYITSFSISPVPGEVLVRIMKDRGFQISTGSACSSKNRKKQMRVLQSSGIDEKTAAGSIRISLGWTTSEQEINDFCLELETQLLELRKYIRK